MPHCDPDALALRALGEALDSPADEEHLAACPRCQSELAQLRDVVSASRAAGPDDRLVPPPPYVWERVVEELGLGGTDRARPSAMAAGPSARRWRTPIVAVAAGFVGAALGAGAVALLDESGGPDEAGRVIATATLDPLPGTDGSGTAQVQESPQGRELVVEVSAPDREEGFREVWLLDADSGRLLSLGVLAGSRGSFALPPGLDLGDFPLVDISREPFDGDPAHSGASIVRGRIGV